MVTPTNKPTDQQGEYNAIRFFEDRRIEGRDLQFDNSVIWEKICERDTPDHEGKLYYYLKKKWQFLIQISFKLNTHMFN